MGKKDNMSCNLMGGNFYGLGFVGAAVYYINHAVTFWGGVLGILKAAVWPAMIMYKVLELWKM
jgi:hypothetical protein